MATMKIVIDQEVHQKIMYWVNKSQYEVSGFGNVLVEKDGTLRVISAVLTKQENSAAETDIKAADVAKALFESRDVPGEMRWWWHSHVNMPVFWSGTDHQAMRDFASTPESWIICTVFNKKNEKRSCYFAPQGCETPWGKSVLLFDDLPTSLSEDADKIASWEAEYTTKVTNPGDKYRHAWAKGGSLGLTDKTHKPVRPPGMTKKEWKESLKKLAEETKTGETDKTKFNIDEYGFNQDERAELSASGWTLHDVDTLISRGFTARQIVILCEADFLAEDVVQELNDRGETVLSIMKEAYEIRRAAAFQKSKLSNDDAPVSRDKSVIDMRKESNYEFNEEGFDGMGHYLGYGG